MGSPLVPLGLAGAAVVLLSSGKKRKKSVSGGPSSYNLPTNTPIPQVYGGAAAPSPEATESQTEWVDRQKALQAISQIEFFTKDGGSVSLCSKCHPGDADGKPGKNTRAAVKAFQAISGLSVDGEWDANEDRAMHRILTAVANELPISCDPLLGYPSPFACFVHGDGFALMLVEGTEGTKPAPKAKPSPSPAPAPSPSPSPSPSEEQKEFGPDELLVADAECNYILHQDDKWFTEQRRRMIEYALDGMTDSQAATEIHESMLADYIPLCLSLGRNGVGSGVRQFWDVNLGHVASGLKTYDLLPDLLEEDAIKFGLL